AASELARTRERAGPGAAAGPLRASRSARGARIRAPGGEEGQPVAARQEQGCDVPVRALGAGPALVAVPWLAGGSRPAGATEAPRLARGLSYDSCASRMAA